ncbi:MAG: HEAT repeat domain-containing protein [Acidimicrobiales bacterium]|jgi:HEAT repeat protein
MTALDLLIAMLIAITSAIVVVLATVGISSLIRAHRIRIEPSLSKARSAIMISLSGGSTATDELSDLGWFSRRYIIGLTLDVAPSVTGTSRSILVSLGEAIGVVQKARRNVNSRRWGSRLYAARVLTAFGVESDALCRLLVDRSPEVRAQAAAWTVVAPDPMAIDLLVGLLADSDGLCRFAARDALIRIGLRASEPLISALDAADVDVDVTNQILEIAAAMGDGRFLPAAVVRTGAPAPRTRALAARVLARTGDRSAGPSLVGLLQDGSDEVVVAAAAGISKLSYWPGAAAIEPLLNSPSWALRRQAGLSLLGLGAPGTVLLWANAPGEGDKAEMAIQALHLRSISHRSEAA